MDEETLRRLAIWRFEQGDRAEEIWKRLGRSRRWTSRWLARYRAEGLVALAGRSRARRGHPAAVPETVRAKVFERFFNERRRHGGIGYTVPASRFPEGRRRLNGGRRDRPRPARCTMI